MSILRITVSNDRVISRESLEAAICLKCDNCYGALRTANAFGGDMTDAWYLCHNHSLKELLDEATAQKIDLSNLQTAIHHTPVTDSLYYKRAVGEITEDEFRKEFSKWRRGG